MAVLQQHNPLADGDRRVGHGAQVVDSGGQRLLKPVKQPARRHGEQYLARQPSGERLKNLLNQIRLYRQNQNVRLVRHLQGVPAGDNPQLPGGGFQLFPALGAGENLPAGEGAAVKKALCHGLRHVSKADKAHCLFCHGRYSPFPDRWPAKIAAAAAAYCEIDYSTDSPPRKRVSAPIIVRVP